MRILLGCLAAFTLAWSTTAQARPPGPPPLHEVLVDQADELGISPDQIVEIEALAEAHRPEARAAHNAMRTAVQSGDEVAIEAARTQLEALREGVESELEAVLGEELWASVQAELPPPPKGPRAGGPPPRGPAPGDVEE